MSRIKSSKPRLKAEGGSRLSVKEWPKTSFKRIRGRAWMNIREQVFVRDGYKCQCCGHVVASHQAECDHIVALADGGNDELSNLQTLCIDCHAEKSAKENRQR
ncbi:HNH endonuclease [Neisseria weixii]|uniref:HNH endonuclease n=1 Tax=Neisseria weixii TaxID=1853276 RepID=A0A3N4N2N6_9NEIS|nr:HNH endonuclease [Neisseria weixii]RPD90504.1 HNH endonuclease [Neisseria weixii]RPD90554.1 HNH endonuclease [Neisseria weixii]